MVKCKIGVLFVMFGFLGWTLRGCLGIPPQDPPYGTWQSDEPELVLDIGSGRKGNPYPGTYVLDGKEVNTWISYDSLTDVFMIQTENAYSPGGPIYGSDEYIYFYGHYKLTDNQLIFTLRDDYAKESGYDEIIFEKVEEDASSSSGS